MDKIRFRTHNVEFWRRFLFLFLPVVIFALIAGVYLHYAKKKAVEDSYVAEHKERVLLAKQNLMTELKGYITDLLLISTRHEVFEMAENPTPDVEKKLEFLLRDLLHTKGVYDKAAYLDVDGYELVSVDIDDPSPFTPKGGADSTDRKPAGFVGRMLEMEEEQNNFSGEFGDDRRSPPPRPLRETREKKKSEDLDHLDKLITLEHGMVYHSQMELDRENNEIEKPYNPVIRFAVPVFKHTGRRAGMIVLNLKADAFLERMTQITDDTLGYFELINKDGFWLLAQNPEHEFGFEFPNMDTFTVARRDPELWNVIAKPTTTDHHLDDDGLDVFTTFNPFEVKTDSNKTDPLNTNTTVGDTTYIWTLISHVPHYNLYSELHTYTRNLTFGLIVLVFFHFIGSIIIARTILMRRETELKHKQLETLQEVSRTIAHEFRQPLSGLHLIADFAQMSKDDPGKILPKLERIPRLVDRMEELVSRLLNITEVKSTTYADDVNIIDLWQKETGATESSEDETATPEKESTGKPEE